MKNDRTIYLQISYILADENVIQREYSPFDYLKDHYEKYVVTLDEITLPSREGVQHIQAWKLSDILNGE